MKGIICQVKYMLFQDGKEQHITRKQKVTVSGFDQAVLFLEELVNEISGLEGALVTDRGLVRDIF